MEKALEGVRLASDGEGGAIVGTAVMLESPASKYTKFSDVKGIGEEERWSRRKFSGERAAAIEGRNHN